MRMILKVQHAAQDMECENEDNNKACCPICQEEMPFDILEVHASECGESPVDNDVNNTAEFSIMDNDVNNTAEFSIMDNDWKTHLDPKIAAFLYRKEILRLHETGKPLFMCMDIRSSPEEQDRQLINFYKQRNVEWACPVKCQLQGDVAVGDGVSRHFFSTVVEKLKYGFSLNLGNTGVTCLFEGEPDHLVPSSSQLLIESDLFVVAGRMLGHSFLHGGPCLAGLSRAFVHVLLQGSQDTATLQLEDCPDVDIRETINLLRGQSPLNEDEYSKVLELCLSWDLPGPTDENRRWLYERLLSHAVIGRRTRQIKQIKRGLKDTFVWPLLTERTDVVFFPKESEDLCTSEMLLSHISWATESDNEDDEYSADTKERITGYLRQFIETASAKDLKDLLKFWVRWDRMEANMAVEVVKSDLPKSSTCFCVLRLPGHYNDFQSFTNDLTICIGTCKFGFGHV
ncbi:G2/M phase-specific E3 ubiquitin-protein ligase-like isoform X2 [Onychostoma macrolepis]|uniref:G2/M phase-specific E3 ubiquitin-protein ligase-like isoform X2 n=1 Tax=Onychostoma macrolepis TaxID=369639 RepID=UPI00272D28A4|nr:G2/M phase-specific E3 ubiquitin-protein ligase-like isoform X2 [Onychostoma macrolepis]